MPKYWLTSGLNSEKVVREIECPNGEKEALEVATNWADEIGEKVDIRAISSISGAIYSVDSEMIYRWATGSKSCSTIRAFRKVREEGGK